jgi:membrane-associated phospholipid phosphatase
MTLSSSVHLFVLLALAPGAAHSTEWVNALWERTRRAVVASSTDPAVWVPLAGALALQVGSADEVIANWARREAPLFGSPGRADDASDVLRDATEWTYWGAAAVRVLGDPPSTWITGVATSAALGYMGHEFNQLLTNGSKTHTRRLRPDGSDRLSFPSGHTSMASVRAALTWQQVRRSRLPQWGRDAVGWTAAGLAAGTAWARVEAGRHYPSDVLVGWALGRWVGHFLGELVLGETPGLDLAIAPSSIGLDGWLIELTIHVRA